MTSEGKPNGIHQPRENSGRIRRSTLERFNEELAILDRPLEDEVEYYDDIPPSPWPKWIAIGAAMFLLSGAAGIVFLRHNAATTPVAAIAVAAPAPAPTPAPETPMPGAPGIEVASIPAPAAAAPAPEALEADVAGDDADDQEVVDAIPSDVPSVAAAVAPSAWSKIGSQAGRSSGHTKRSRVASHKTIQRSRARHR